MDLTQQSVMLFAENQQGSAILDKLRMQTESGRFCDVVFQVQDKQFLAHRNVLAACSPYFDTMLKVNKISKEFMSVNCKSSSVFKILLEYIYTGKVSIIKESVEELLKLANQFMISKLKNYCSEYLERNMTVKNCFGIKKVAKKCGLPILAKTADAFIYANITDVIEEQEIVDFDFSKVDQFLSNKTLPMTEEMKLHLVCRWVEQKLEERQYKFQVLVNYIQWQKADISNVYAIIRDKSIFSTSEWCLYNVLQVLQNNGILYSMYVESLEHLRQKVGQQYLNNTADSVQAALSGALQNYAKQASEPSGKDDDQKWEIKQQLSPKLSQIMEDPGIVQVPSVSVITHTEEEDDGGIGVMRLQGDYGESDCSQHEGQFDTLRIRTEQSVDSTHCPSVNNKSSSLLNVEENTVTHSTPITTERRGRHKRKGIPVKVRIPRMQLEVKLPKRRRGRPPKMAFKKEIPKPKIKVKQRIMSDEDELESFSEDEDNLDFDQDLFDTDPELGTNLDLPLKRGRGRPKGKKKKEKYNCPKCFFVCTDSLRLERHTKKAHNEDLTYECNFCEFTSKWNREYYQHMRQHFPGPPHKCDEDACDYTCDRIQPLLIHRMTHSDERPYQCTICNMRFRTKNNLATHHRCHTGEKPFRCEVCGRDFATKGTLEQHSVTHSDIRPYLCDTCGFSTKYQSHLIAHKRIHTGDVFRCQYPNCKYVTPKRSQLACHMRSHMSIRSHICSVCGRGFVEKSHLVRHERIHLDDKPFKCHLCEYSSTRRDKLKEHVIKYHGETSPTKVPYKPRRQRRQTFDPQLFPGITQAQAAMQSLIQATDQQPNKQLQQHQQQPDPSMSSTSMNEDVGGNLDDPSVLLSHQTSSDSIAVAPPAHVVTTHVGDLSDALNYHNLVSTSSGQVLMDLGPSHGPISMAMQTPASIQHTMVNEAMSGVSVAQSIHPVVALAASVSNNSTGAINMVDPQRMPLLIAPGMTHPSALTTALLSQQASAQTLPTLDYAHHLLPQGLQLQHPHPVTPTAQDPQTAQSTGPHHPTAHNPQADYSNLNTFMSFI